MGIHTPTRVRQRRSPYSSIVIASLLSPLLFPDASAQNGQVGARINQGGIQRTYHVKTNGNDNNLGTSSSQAFKTFRKAIDTARNSSASLKGGKKTKIYIHNGIYNAATNSTWLNAGDWPGSSRNTVLIIEGQSRDGVIFDCNNAQETAIQISGKSNLVVKKLSFREAKWTGNRFLGPLTLQWGGTVNDTTNVLVENCTFRNNGGTGATFFRVRYLTMRNCTTQNNGSSGLRFQGKGALIENVTSTNNNTGNRADFSRAGMAFAGWDSIVRNSTFNDNNFGVGFRMDVASERVTIQNLTCNRNDTHGMMFETAIGPTLIKNCTANSNGANGLHLYAAQRVTVDGCLFQSNTKAGIGIGDADRSKPNNCPACRAWDLSKTDSNDKKPVSWNINNTVRNTTIVTANTASSKIIDNVFTSDGPWARHYREQFVPNLFTGNNNRYWSYDSRAFETNFGVFVDLKGWKAATGSEGNSHLLPKPNTDYVLRNLGHNRNLSALGDQPDGSGTPDWNVRTTTGTGNNEKWRFIDAGGGYVFAVNKGRNRRLQGLGNPSSWNVRTVENSANWNWVKWRISNSDSPSHYLIRNQGHNRNLSGRNGSAAWNVNTGTGTGTWERWRIR